MTVTNPATSPTFGHGHPDPHQLRHRHLVRRRRSPGRPPGFRPVSRSTRSTGTITGTPPSAGGYTVTVKATDTRRLLRQTTTFTLDDHQHVSVTSGTRPVHRHRYGHHSAGQLGHRQSVRRAPSPGRLPGCRPGSRSTSSTGSITGTPDGGGACFGHRDGHRRRRLFGADPVLAGPSPTRSPWPTPSQSNVSGTAITTLTRFGHRHATGQTYHLDGHRPAGRPRSSTTPRGPVTGHPDHRLYLFGDGDRHRLAGYAGSASFSWTITNSVTVANPRTSPTCRDRPSPR